MKVIALTINGKIIECADCVSWSLQDNAPACALHIEPMACATCTQGVERQRLTPKPIASLASRAASWAKAEASALLSSVTDAAYESRVAACIACEHRDTSGCEGEEIGWCKACGCGRTAAAELSRKARLPRATCPASRW